jgi:hypothetical protein
MPSTFSTSLRLELIGNGEQAANWGNTTNTNLGTLLEQAITGVATVTFPTDADRTLTASNGVSDESRNAVLVLTSGVSLTATRNLIVPTVNKFYAVRNATSGSQSVTVKTSAGTGVTVANGYTQLMYCDGTNVVQATVQFNSTNSNAIVQGTTLQTGNGQSSQISNIQYNSSGSVSYYLNTDGSAGFSDATRTRWSSDSSGNFSIYNNITMNNSTLVGSTYYSPNFTSSPGGYPISFRCAHQPGVTASAQFILGSAIDAVFTFRNDGYGISNTGWITASDRRVKDNQKTIEDALSKLKQINGITYKRNDISKIDGSSIMNAGLLAQDVAAVLPEAIEITGLAPANDPEGPGLMSLNYNGVIALLVNAVKELSAKVDALEKKAAG